MSGTEAKTAMEVTCIVMMDIAPFIELLRAKTIIVVMQKEGERMTREDRKNVLHCLKVMIDEEVCEECNLYGTTGTDHCEKDCVRMAIEALQTEPYFWEKCPYYEPDIMFDGKEEYDWGKCTYKPEPCEDCISREDVISAITDLWEPIEYRDEDEFLEFLKKSIERIPSVQPTQRVSKWIDEGHYDELYGASMKCLRCRRKSIGGGTYCKWCGAKMERSESNGTTD